MAHPLKDIACVMTPHTNMQDCQVVIREPYQDGRETTWTGTGFMRVYEGSHLEFDINDIQNTLDYDLVLRYEPQVCGELHNVRMSSLSHSQNSCLLRIPAV